MDEVQNLLAGFEPSANAREFAKAMFDMFAAMLKEGFTERQALAIIGQMLAANAPGRE